MRETRFSVKRLHAKIHKYCLRDTTIFSMINQYFNPIKHERKLFYSNVLDINHKTIFTANIWPQSIAQLCLTLAFSFQCLTPHLQVGLYSIFYCGFFRLRHVKNRLTDLVFQPYTAYLNDTPNVMVIKVITVLVLWLWNSKVTKDRKPKLWLNLACLLAHTWYWVSWEELYPLRPKHNTWYNLNNRKSLVNGVKVYGVASLWPLLLQSNRIIRFFILIYVSH